MTQPLRWGFGLSPDALPLLRRLLAAGLLDRLALPPNDDHWPSGGLPTFLAEEWPRSSAFVAVGACGAITRLVAPVLNHKSSDPAVVVLDPAGRFAVPLLGGHAAGGEALAQAIAAAIGGEAVLTGASQHRGLLALDGFGRQWGWRRGSGDWDELIKAAQLDGAGFWQIFWRIIWPLSTPILVVTLIWQFTAIWNDFLYGVVFSGADSKPVTVGLNNLANTTSSVKAYNVDMAAALIAALPTLVVYVVAGKYFVRGLTAGAVKG